MIAQKHGAASATPPDVRSWSYRLESFMEGDIQEMIDALAAHFQSLALSGGGE